MALIRRKQQHYCTPPMMIAEMGGIAVVDGQFGDLWRCDDCRRIWECRFTRAYPGKAWWRPSWFTRLKFWRAPDLELDFHSAEIFLEGRAEVSPDVPSDPWGEGLIPTYQFAGVD